MTLAGPLPLLSGICRSQGLTSGRCSYNCFPANPLVFCHKQTEWWCASRNAINRSSLPIVDYMQQRRSTSGSKKVWMCRRQGSANQSFSADHNKVGEPKPGAYVGMTQAHTEAGRCRIDCWLRLPLLLFTCMQNLPGLFSCW